MEFAQNVENYFDYRKCGEILKPPSSSYQRPCILQCFQCKKIYLLFETFLLHIKYDCKSFARETITNLDNPYISKIYAGDGHMELDDVCIKEEINVSYETDDPLISVKNEVLSDNDEPSSSNRNLSSFDYNTNNISNNNDENKLSTEEDICVKGFVEISNSSDEEVEDDVDELKTENEQKNDLDTSLESSNFITQFLKNKDDVIAFIDAFKARTTLWNRNYPYFRTKIERQNCYQQIANELNEKHHDMALNSTNVQNLIIYLYRNYREDLRYINESKESEKSYTPSWFFEHLNFIKPFVERNHIANLDSHMPDLLPNQIIEILRIYKELPQLWNTEVIEHYCKNKIDAAKQDMLQALETNLDIKITENVLEKYIFTIKNCFKRAKRSRLKKKSGQNNSGTSTKKSKLEDYYEHMIFLKDHIGRFYCSECKKPFKNPMYLKIHQSSVHNFEPFPCSKCKKSFKSVSCYTDHAKRHMQDLSYGCKECDKKFLYLKELKIHMRRHNEIKPFCCEICGSLFRHIQSFKTHQRRHMKNYLHTCEICGKGFYTRDRYRDHMNSHSDTSKQMCNVCGKAFITKKSLQQHAVVCSKSFKKKRANLHMKTHGITNNKEESTTELNLFQPHS